MRLADLQGDGIQVRQIGAHHAGSVAVTRK